MGIPMGLVLAQLQVNDDEAFDALRRISQNTDRKLRDVTDDIISHRRISRTDRADPTGLSALMGRTVGSSVEGSLGDQRQSST
jgi:ANTAR domain